jgi:hypothetical protein
MNGALSALTPVFVAIHNLRTSFTKDIIMNQQVNVTRAATLASTYIISGQFACDSAGAKSAVKRASATYGLTLSPMEQAHAMAATLRQSSVAVH